MSGLVRRRAPQGGKCADPTWRQARAVKAGIASSLAYRAQREARGEAYPTKAAAYAAGYRLGWRTAWAWWRRRTRRAAA